jgi:hypothetical protein
MLLVEEWTYPAALASARLIGVRCKESSFTPTMTKQIFGHPVYFQGIHV